METDYRLSMSGITKSFGATRALKGVELLLKPGEIHALIGENGAGKSTLMNILGGVFHSDSGCMMLDGENVSFNVPADSRDAGVSFIHQELNLVDDLKVFQNIFLGEEPKYKSGMLNDREMIKTSGEILKRVGVDIDPEAEVSTLNASYKQVVEISRSLRQKSSIIIMDEPTTSLADHEIENLFKIMNSLKAEGVSIIFISHKLKEVLTICSRYTVFRDGENSGSGNISDIDEQGLVKLMVGKELVNEKYYEKRDFGEVLLQAVDLQCSPHFKDINFKIKKGQIAGFTGLLGDGRSEVFETVFGFRQSDAGEIRVKGKAVAIKSPRHALKARIGLLPKNRKQNSIIASLSVRENATIAALKNFVKGLSIDKRKEKNRVSDLIREIKIKTANMDDPITSLSGGNQQKVVLAKWLTAESDILILDNPTQGIDVGAKAEIYHLLTELAKKGKAIIVLSSEFNEILRICDEIYVMYHGEITGHLNRNEADEETLMLYTTGVKRDRIGNYE